MSEHVNEPIADAPPAKTPREYVQPLLVHYGSVTKLTQNMSGSQGDGAGTSNRRSSCL